MFMTIKYQMNQVIYGDTVAFVVAAPAKTLQSVELIRFMILSQ